jgi:hypothetical protein
MDFLFHFQLLIGVIAQNHLAQPKTDFVESTTVQHLWACVTTKKLILDIKYKIFLISFNIVFKVHGLFISLSTFNWRHSSKSLSSVETDLVETNTQGVYIIR